MSPNEKSPLRVVLLGDDPYFLTHVAALIRESTDAEVIGLSRPEQIIDFLQTNRECGIEIDVLLTRMDLSHVSHSYMIREMRRRGFETSVMRYEEPINSHDLVSALKQRHIDGPRT